MGWGNSRDKQKEKLKAANDRAEDGFRKKAEEFIARHPHGSPHYTPNPFPGVTCEMRADRNGRYHYILKLLPLYTRQQGITITL